MGRARVGAMANTSIIHSNPGLWRRIRRQTLIRDSFTCQIALPQCTVTATQADHIVPRWNGGTDELDNLQAACAHCNKVKGGGFLDIKRLQNTSRLNLSPFIPLQGSYSQRTRKSEE